MVYFRSHTGNFLVSYAEPALRWSISKATVSRILTKLQNREYLLLIPDTPSIHEAEPMRNEQIAIMETDSSVYLRFKTAHEKVIHKVA